MRLKPTDRGNEIGTIDRTDSSHKLNQGMTTPRRRIWIWWTLASLVTIVGASCRRVEPPISEHALPEARCPFAIYWPPRDPSHDVPASFKPLLRGSLAFAAKDIGDGVAQANLVVTITRPSAEVDREFWNSQLAFADIALQSGCAHEAHLRTLILGEDEEEVRPGVLGRRTERSHGHDGE